MESCWASESGIGSCITTGCAPSLSAQLTVPSPTGLISRVCLPFPLKITSVLSGTLAKRN